MRMLLAEAQRLGYAESDPTNDVEGIDAAYKMVILSQFAFGMNIQFDQVGHKGISQITPQDVSVAQSLGYVIKLVGSIVETESGIAAEVTPTFLPKQHPLAGVNDVMNAVYVESIGIGSLCTTDQVLVKTNCDQCRSRPRPHCPSSKRRNDR